jgi:hypothetical protein
MQLLRICQQPLMTLSSTEASMPKMSSFFKRTAVIALFAAAMGVASLAPLAAKNFAVPTKNPTVTLAIPDNWKTEEIEFGYSAVSPGKDVFFSVEFASVNKVETLMKNNEKWMKDNKIKMVKPTQVEAPLNGIASTIIRFETTDENGPTTLEFIMMPGGDNRVIVFTLWGSDDERKKHGAAIDAMMSSIKAIN